MALITHLFNAGKGEQRETDRGEGREERGLEMADRLTLLTNGKRKVLRRGEEKRG